MKALEEEADKNDLREVVAAECTDVVVFNEAQVPGWAKQGAARCSKCLTPCVIPGEAEAALAPAKLKLPSG